MSERRATFRGRLRRPAHDGDDTDDVVEIDPRELSGIFAAPRWMRDLGFSSWLLVGLAAALVGAVWLLATTQTIVMPVITAAIIASVTSPLVDKLKARHVPRAIGAVLVFLGILLIGLGVGYIVIKGVSTQAGSLTTKLHAGADKLSQGLKDLGVSSKTAADANAHASSSVSAAFKALTHGVVGGIERLASLAVFLSFTALSLFFLLKDAPTIGAFVERHMGVPQRVAHGILGRLVKSMRGYFVGVTVVSVWSSLIVLGGCLILNVPLPGTIAVVTFLGGYVPYLGAWTAGAFGVLIALGAKGTQTAIILAVIILLANGVLQQLVQPIAMGVALSLHPLAVLIVTISGGCLFGTVGLVLAAPLVSAAVRISGDIAAAERREAQAAEAEAAAPA